MDESLAATSDFCEKLKADLNLNESSRFRIIPKLEGLTRGYVGMPRIIDTLTVEYVIGDERTGVYHKLCVDLETQKLLGAPRERKEILERSLAGLLALARSPDRLKPSSKSNFVGKWVKEIRTDFPFCLFDEKSEQIIEFVTGAELQLAYGVLLGAGRKDPNLLHMLKFEEGHWIEIDPMS